MQHKNHTLVVLGLAFLVAAGGFIISFWPLELVGVLMLALLGRPLYAVLLGFLLDLAYGAPTGHLHMLLFPFTLAALAANIARYFGKKYFFDASAQETL